MEVILNLFFVQFVLLWLGLVVTGRIFDFLTTESDNSWKDDALASLIIVVLTNIAGIIAIFAGLPFMLVVFAYFALIYYAYQLDGIVDIMTFYILHVIVLRVITLFITIPMFAALDQTGGAGAGGVGGF